MLSNVSNNQRINRKAKVVHLSGVKKIITRDGTKSKADCCLVDPSGSIKLTLWEDLITEVADDNTYNFCNLKVRKDNDNYSIYLTTPKHDCFISPADPFQEEVASPVDLPDYFTQTSTNAAVLGVQNFMCYRQCCKCNKKLLATPGNVVKHMVSGRKCLLAATAWAASHAKALFLFTVLSRSCSDLKRLDPKAKSGICLIDPDGEGGFLPFLVTCEMTDKDGVGVTVISHDSEKRTLVDGYEAPGSYSRSIFYKEANISQLVSLINVSQQCEQFIKYECRGSTLKDGFWLSRDSERMTYWSGEAPESDMCACGINKSCAKPSKNCNCHVNDNVWRQDSGFLTNKTHLPVKQLRFGDTGTGANEDEMGYHTLGKFKCYGIA
ncbi:Neurexin-4 [Stylophora pistillata]|uniref:Neurexin-4 n=1 Tax=Stylophora pistillata TaxID=50429 RepID=A0A2B4R986_STYPI|nr:Neurexin-4 [Stylophora pistillata]